jgi:hypothetical protein
MGPRILLKALKFDMMCKRRMVPKWVNYDAGGTAGVAASLDAGSAWQDCVMLLSLEKYMFCVMMAALDLCSCLLV